MVVMRVCGECMKMCWFTSVWGTTAATGGTRCVWSLWGVAWGCGCAGTEVIVVVVTYSGTYTVTYLSFPVVGDVDSMCSSVQSWQFCFQLAWEFDASDSLLWDGTEVTFDASPPARVIPPQLHHAVKVNDVQEPGHQNLTRPLPWSVRCLQLMTRPLVVLPPTCGKERNEETARGQLMDLHEATSNFVIYSPCVTTHFNNILLGNLGKLGEKIAPEVLDEDTRQWYYFLSKYSANITKTRR